MKKIIAMLVMSLLFVGCSSKEDKQLKVIVPSGATALSLVGIYDKDNKNPEMTITEGTDVISSELVKKDGEFDMIVAPINLGCQLIAKGQTEYKLAGVITWGNLYLVENENVDNGKVVAFGEQAVPGKILNLVKDSFDVVKGKEINYLNAVSDVQAQVLSNKYQYALMAEPAATATIAKAKENNITVKIVASLQDAYQKQMNTETAGYPQAGIFVKNKENTQALLDKIDTFTNQEALKDNHIETLLSQYDAKIFGVPNATIAQKTWTRQNIHYKAANTIKEDIKVLLKQFNIEYDDKMIIS